MKTTYRNMCIHFLPKDDADYIVNNMGTTRHQRIKWAITDSKSNTEDLHLRIHNYPGVITKPSFIEAAYGRRMIFMEVYGKRQLAMEPEVIKNGCDYFEKRGKEKAEADKIIAEGEAH